MRVGSITAKPYATMQHVVQDLTSTDSPIRRAQQTLASVEELYYLLYMRGSTEDLTKVERQAAG